MMFALLTLVAAIQTSPTKPQETPQPVIVPVSRPAPVPPLPASAEAAAPVEAEAEEPAYEPEPELPTRQVCRYVEVTGQRFPVRTCRTITIHPDDPA